MPPQIERSNASKQSDMHVVVTGDVVMDWNLSYVGKVKMQNRSEEFMNIHWQRGGAALLADLIDANIRSLQSAGSGQIILHQTKAPQQPVAPGDDSFIHDYIFWESVEEKKTPVWRAKSLMGYKFDPKILTTPRDWQYLANDVENADLVVLDDADLGFRNFFDIDGIWPRVLKNPARRPWILIKCAVPVKSSSQRGSPTNAVWERLLENYSDRIILIFSVNELRKADVQISQELSWERTVQDLYWELVYNLSINKIARCAHVIVSFGAAGAFLLSHPELEHLTTKSPEGKTTDASSDKQLYEPHCYLFFDPNVVENLWEQDHPGKVIGIMTTLTGAIARQILLNPTNPDIHKGIKTGLGAMRNLHLEGYGTPGKNGIETEVKYPIDRITKEYAKDPTIFAEITVRDPFRSIKQEFPGTTNPFQVARPLWTILEDRYIDNLQQVAETIVLIGPERALEGIPIGKFGKLTTVDRNEIESYRSIRILVNEYCQQAQERPLNIAVFGAPGSGKSFGITQIATSLFPDQIKRLEFNLSQFGSVDDLYLALHQVRDVALEGKIPLVFWDEFDSTMGGKEFGWLRYFLMPMQDGKFQEGEISHPIGRAIFVFAGGTCKDVKEFEARKADENFRNAKIPDFLSRLKGIVNIRGPNRAAHFGPDMRDPDPYYIIRRAFALRSIFDREKTTAKMFTTTDDKAKRLNIDAGVLRAFLMTREYKHGVRSIESLVMMSTISGKSKYERSSLPPESQLELHVDSREFMALVQQLELEGDLLELFARVHHELYREKNPAAPPYEQLSDHEKVQNRDAVRDIPRKLALIGYVMVPARGNTSPVRFANEEVELLAEAEHMRWGRAKIAAGWAYGPERDPTNKQHPDLLAWSPTPWEKLTPFSNEEKEALGSGVLPDSEKDKNRQLIRHIPQILNKAGYILRKL